MTMLTSLTETELQKLIAEAVRGCLAGAVPPPPPEQSDRIDIDEFCAMTGYAKPTAYKLSSQGYLPFAERFGKRLVFSRKEVIKWMRDRTVRKPSPIETAVAHLQAEHR